MGLVTSLTALSEAIDPRLAYWSLTLTNGREWDERHMVVEIRKGQRGVRKLDWSLDLVSTGDIHRVKELRLHCPDGRIATLEITPDTPPFQFKAKSLDLLGADILAMEYQVIGRVIDKASGRCECFIWDYRPKPGAEHLIAYKSSIYHFGAWRDTVTPIGALGLEVQGFRLA